MKDQNPVEAARRWLEKHNRIALATVVSTWGSAPVPIGGQLAVAPGEHFAGSVSGGCVEADVIAEAAEVMAGGHARLLSFGVTDEMAWLAGLPCGGTIKIFLEPLEARPDSAFLDRILDAQRLRQTLLVSTDVSTGSRDVLEEGSSLPPAAAVCLRSGKSQLIETHDGGNFIQVFLPPVRLIIAGATHIGQVLASLAREIGYDVVVVDPRGAFATEDRFADTKIVNEWPKDAMATLGVDARSAIVALTHAEHIDDEALSAALRSPCIYIGALGSKRTQAKRVERLKNAGFSEVDMARIHAPVGLAIGAQGPAEIAVSVLAEIVKVVRGVE